MKPETRSQFTKFMESVGDGFFSKINGITFGFSINGESCAIFDTAESDDYREEVFESVDAALDGFKIDKGVLADFVGKLEITPCQSV